MYATNSRVLATVAGQLRKARVVSRIDCGSKVIDSDARDGASEDRGGDAYVIRLGSGQRITVQGSTLQTNSKGERS